MEKAFSSSALADPKVVSQKLESLVFPEDISECPLCTIINLEKRHESEIIAAESLVALVKVIEREVERKVNEVIQEVLQLQLLNEIYSEENLVANDVYEFYLKEVSSNSHKLKGDRFDIKKAITNLLTPSKVGTQTMAYGKKMESVALKEYKKLMEQNFEIVQVDLVVNINQPWLCCSPDAILIYGSAVWRKKVVEIKCP
ncbi:hypothetical protein PV325_007924 [Microctonus aethiopoides]|nr:hypothetical protein PV325_007924 [Microctonus aethiopoides]